MTGISQSVLNPANRTNAFRKIKSTWERFAPDDPLVYYYYDQEFNRMYRTEMAAKNIMLVFTILAVIISCLGLLGMASYTSRKADQRSRNPEIIRCQQYFHSKHACQVHAGDRFAGQPDSMAHGLDGYK